MVQNLFSAVVKMTVTGSVAIGCVVPARLALRRAPRVFSCWLWAVVLLRLLCPVSMTSPVSVMGVVEPPRMVVSAEPEELVGTQTGIPVQNAVTPDGIQSTVDAPSASAAEPEVDWNLAAAWIWAVGAIGMAAHGIVSYVNLKRKIRDAVPAEPGVREFAAGGTPFVLGFFKPVIYLPAGLEKREREYILLHERLHVRHLDPQMRMLFFGAVCLHWFNPLVWLAFRLCVRDLELRCDEAVLRRLGGGVRSDYAQSLLNFATGRHGLAAPLAFGEGDTGKRVRNVLSWKKEGKRMMALAAAVCLAVSLMAGCDPAPHLAETQRVFDSRYRAEAVLGEADRGIYYPRTYDSQLCCQKDGEQIELGQLVEKRLGSGFDLSDESLEQKLRQENDLAWRTGEYWLLYQTDGSVYLTEGRDRVLRLDQIRKGSVRVQTAQAFGNLYRLMDYPAGSGLWAQEQQNIVAVSSEATLVFTISTEEKTLNVVEEYHQMEPDGTETVTETPHILERTRDYGYELPIARRGAYDGDWAMYRVDIGLSSYVFYVRFGMAATQTRNVTFSENGAYIRLQLPGDWEYALTSYAENETMAGIRFWPRGYSDAALEFSCYDPYFGICGTDLEETEMILGNRSVWAGTYGLDPIWSFISFDKQFAVVGYGHEAWWDEYGDVAMEILNTAEFGFTE